ncbi:MAG: hypothetical protein RH862_08600 [Leptospiraceae bacterium]
MDESLVTSYKTIAGELAISLTEDQHKYILRQLENLRDDTREIDIEFQRHKESNPAPPRFWLAILRTLKYQLNLRSNLLYRYDTFVQAYESLSRMPEPSQDQQQLLKEVGDYLYQVDDLAGIIERLHGRLIPALREAMVETHGMMVEPGEKLYHGKASDDAFEKIRTDLEEMISTCYQLKDQSRIESGLLRMIRLILSSGDKD